MIWYVTAWWEDDGILELRGESEWVYGYEYAVVSPLDCDEICKVLIGVQAFKSREKALAHVRAQVDKEIAKLKDRIQTLTKSWYWE